MKLNFHKFGTALGEMAISWSESGIVAVQLPEERPEITLRKLRSRFPEAEYQERVRLPEYVSELRNKIRAHLRGRSQDFSLADLDLSQLPSFHRKVYRIARKIPAGSVLTYGELAARAGSPRASRAVGQAMAKNPFLLLVPCHRVVAAGKKAGGFSAFGGIATKARLLALESVALGVP